MALRVRPKPKLFQTNICYTPMDNKPLHSIPSVRRSWDKVAVVHLPYRLPCVLEPFLFNMSSLPISVMLLCCHSHWICGTIAFLLVITGVRCTFSLSPRPVQHVIVVTLYFRSSLIGLKSNSKLGQTKIMAVGLLFWIINRFII